MPRRYDDSLSPSPSPSPSRASSPSRRHRRARSTSYSDRRRPVSRSPSLARRSLSASRSRSPPRRGSHSRSRSRSRSRSHTSSRTSRATKVKDKMKEKKEIPYGFLAGIGVSALLLHKYWPKGWVHGEEKYWDNKVGRAGGRVAEVVVERPRGVLREGRVPAGPVLEEMREGWREERAREKGLEVPERRSRRSRSLSGSGGEDGARAEPWTGTGAGAECDTDWAWTTWTMCMRIRDARGGLRAIMTTIGTAWDGIPPSSIRTKGATRKKDGTQKNDDTRQRGATVTTIVDMMLSTMTGLAGGGKGVDVFTMCVLDNTGKGTDTLITKS
ncbi:predicted protein [Verticillium alfalfae VaMs.102]|uniref:Predicted protein n=1 Tax=Verticillium alfalfae (strain VaMs.102 / ATCC MYA-4576 / FGSC 10136) TaxID=526221 RepID=C9SS52_VERA1|nr:predicted protein [Verticillium alfalfae VaMs.102]EEY21617.1 predicted protein [Verticillium alfalfae VaMs.102]